MGGAADSKHFCHIIGKHIEIRPHPDFAGHRSRLPRLCRASIGNQSSHRLAPFREDNLVALLNLLDER